jgi:hypothetical protein
MGQDKLKPTVQNQLESGGGGGGIASSPALQIGGRGGGSTFVTGRTPTGTIGGTTGLAKGLGVGVMGALGVGSAAINSLGSQIGSSLTNIFRNTSSTSSGSSSSVGKGTTLNQEMEIPGYGTRYWNPAGNNGQGTWQINRVSDTPTVVPEVVTGVVPEVVPEVVEDEVVGGEVVGGEISSAVTKFLRENNIRDIYIPSTNIEDYLAEMTPVFRNLYGDDPNFAQIEGEYLSAIREAYDKIVGEGGTLDQARDIADRQFGLAEGQMEKGFRQSRQQLAEQAYLGQRQMQQQLAERGLGGSGLAQLGQVQQRIAEGGAASGLYQQFVDSVQELSLSKASSSLKFAEAEAQLSLALTRDTQEISNRFRQERQQYNQWKGNTIQSLAEAARTGNMQTYSMTLEQWNQGLQAASIIDQENEKAANNQIAITNQGYDALIAEIEANDDLSDEDKAKRIAEIGRQRALALNKITAEFGLTSGDIVTGIMGSQSTVNTKLNFKDAPPGTPISETTGGGFTAGILRGLDTIDDWKKIFAPTPFGVSLPR